MLHRDKAASDKYFKKNLDFKTEQQKFLEEILRDYAPKKVIDVAAGSGTTLLQLSRNWRQSEFTFLDLSSERICQARKLLVGLDCAFRQGSIYCLPFSCNQFDLVLCLQTISWLNNPAKALQELIRICQPNGTIVITGLFNRNHDVDIFAKMSDLTRPSGKMGFSYDYITICEKTIKRWLLKKIKCFRIIPFEIHKTIPQSSRGLGTYTQKMSGGKNIQISGGLLLAWGALVIKK